MKHGPKCVKTVQAAVYGLCFRSHKFQNEHSSFRVWILVPSLIVFAAF